jgi:transcriptional regulator with XRE-family HTH domain
MNTQISYIGPNITWLRQRDRLTQAAVGKHCHVSRVAVAKWESGDSKNLKLTHLFALVDLFKITERQLVRDNLAVSPPALRVPAALSEVPMADYIPPIKLTDDESTILSAYRCYPPEMQRGCLLTARDFLSNQSGSQKQG